MVFGALFLLFDQVIGRFISAGVVHYQSDKRIDRIIMDKCPRDIVIVGSSRALNDFDAGAMSEVLGKSVLNMGYSGANITFKYFIFRLLQDKEQLPETLLYVVDERREFMYMSTAVFRKDAIAPYVYDDFIHDELTLHSKLKNLAGKVSRTYREKENFINALKYYCNGQVIPSYHEQVDDFGFAAIDSISNRLGDHYNTLSEPYSNEIEQAEYLEVFRKIVDESRQNKVELMLVFPPNYYAPAPGFKERLIELAERDLPIFAFDDNRYPKEYFYDQGHLNKLGAKAFSVELAEELRQSKK